MMRTAVAPAATMYSPPPAAMPTPAVAHTPAAVGCAIRQGQALLASCGFTEYCTFQAGKPVWHAF